MIERSEDSYRKEVVEAIAEYLLNVPSDFRTYIMTLPADNRVYEIRARIYEMCEQSSLMRYILTPDLRFSTLNPYKETIEQIVSSHEQTKCPWFGAR